MELNFTDEFLENVVEVGFVTEASFGVGFEEIVVVLLKRVEGGTVAKGSEVTTLFFPAAFSVAFLAMFFTPLRVIFDLSCSSTTLGSTWDSSFLSERKK